MTIIYFLTIVKDNLIKKLCFSSLDGSKLQMSRHVTEKSESTESKGGQDSAAETVHVGERAQIHSQKAPTATGTTDKRAKKSHHGEEV